MKNLAALHEPDMFAGGYFDCKPTCMGDASVNSSIGAQWKKIIADMDKYADDAKLKKMYAEERLKAEIIQEAMSKKW